MLEFHFFDLQFALGLLLHDMQFLIAILPICKTSMSRHLPDLDCLAFAAPCSQMLCSATAL